MAHIDINSLVLENINNDNLISLLNRMIDEELSRDTEDIDAVFVDDCVDALLMLEQEKNNFTALVPLVSSDKFLKKLTKDNNSSFKRLNVFARTAIIAAIIAGSTVSANAMVQSITGINILGTIAQRIEQSIGDNYNRVISEDELTTEPETTTKLDETTTELASTKQNVIESTAVESVVTDTSEKAEVTTQADKTDNNTNSPTTTAQQTTKPNVISGKPVTTQRSKSLVSISADINNFKTDYIYGEEFTYDGLKLYANYSDNTSERLDLKDCYYSKIYLSDAIKDYELTIMYKTCSLKLDITLRPDEETRGSAICCNDDYEYLLTDKGAYITTYKGNDKSIILNTVDKNKIYAISAGAFKNTDITEVYSKNAEKLFNNAFADCSKLESADFTNIKYIGDGAFNNCTELDEINYPDTIEYIGKSAFRKTALTTFELPAQFSEVPDFLLDSCAKLKTVTLNGRVTRVGISAFADCKSLENVTGCENIETVDSFAFCNNEQMTFDEFPQSLRTVGDYAFYLCQSLEIGALPQSITAVGRSSFAYCTGLTSLTIPQGITIIPYEAFRGIGAKTVVLPEGVEVIEAYALRATKATKITLPSTLRVLEAESIYSPLLREIRFASPLEKMADDAVYKGKAVTLYVLDNSLPLEWAKNNNVKFVIL